jgi:hypothetical protein
MLEITLGEDLRLQASAALDTLPKPTLPWISRCGDPTSGDNQVAERFRRAAFSLIQTGAWSLDFSHPLT